MNGYIIFLLIQIFFIILGVLLIWIILKNNHLKKIISGISFIFLCYSFLTIVNISFPGLKFATSIILFLVFITTCIYIIFIYSKEFQKIIKALNALANGDTNYANKLNKNSDFKTLKQLYLTLNNNFKTIISNVEEISKELIDKMSSLSEKCKNVKDGIHKQEDVSNNFNTVLGILSKSIEIGAKGLDETRVMFKKTSDNFNILFEYINKLFSQNLAMQKENETMDQYSLAAIKFTIDLKDITKEGTQKIDNIIDFIVNINTSVKKITEMVTLIKRITAQTNLLAINASIEAAHAGDKGHGFAVVADEIRTLAESSSLATEKITNIVNSIFVEVEQGQVYSNNAKKGIGEINEAFNKNIDFISTLADSINQQIKSVENMKENIEQTHNLAKEIKESTEHQQKQTQEIYESTETLNSQALIIDQLVVKQKMHIDTVINMIDQLDKIINDSNTYTASLPKIINDFKKN
ncbi:MAG: hypothetical protein KAT05_11275 [Spirochaetes bacterium]|nr:hypothetical protein [Spirochaetota bacterium]